MGLATELDVNSDAVRRITAVAVRRSCHCFADLMWLPAPTTLDVLKADPG
jgi:hypothetical protein